MSISKHCYNSFFIATGKIIIEDKKCEIIKKLKI
jgi:hypothetical protein